jgi:hypothetical protein
MSCLDKLQANIMNNLWIAIMAGISGFCANLLSAFHSQGISWSEGSNMLVKPSLVDHWFTITIVFIGFFLINQQGQ